MGNTVMNDAANLFQIPCNYENKYDDDSIEETIYNDDYNDSIDEHTLTGLEDVCNEALNEDSVEDIFQDKLEMLLHTLEFYTSFEKIKKMIQANKRFNKVCKDKLMKIGMIINNQDNMNVVNCVHIINEEIKKYTPRNLLSAKNIDFDKINKERINYHKITFHRRKKIMHVIKHSFDNDFVIIENNNNSFFVQNDSDHTFLHSFEYQYWMWLNYKKPLLYKLKICDQEVYTFIIF